MINVNLNLARDSQCLTVTLTGPDKIMKNTKCVTKL